MTDRKKQRRAWRLLRRPEQARRAEDRIRTNERVRKYTREARRKGADEMGLMQAVFRGVYEDAITEMFRPPIEADIFSAFPLSEAGAPYVEAELLPLRMDLEDVGKEFKEPIRMTIPEGWAPAVPDDERPEWPYRWKPKAWLAKRGYERLLPKVWP